MGGNARAAVAHDDGRGLRLHGQLDRAAAVGQGVVNQVAQGNGQGVDVALHGEGDGWRIPIEALLGLGLLPEFLRQGGTQLD